jgi:ubiquinone biosynthesis protein
MPATTPNARYREVLRILVRRGFGFAVGSRSPFSGDLDAEAARTVRPVQLRLAFEELGTAFIKLGQILSTRSDLLPPEYIAELRKLQSAVPPIETAQVVATIEQQLRRPIGELFVTFDPVPLAAASIGQVHAVTLPGGTDAVIKVQRPGVRAQVLLDLEIGGRIARLIAARIRPSALGGIDVEALVEEFSWTLRNELDFVREARNAERFQRNFVGNALVYIPAICWEYSTPTILTMERLRGIRIDDVPALTAAGYDPAQIATNSAQLILQEIFDDGFFQADPHPGNLFVLDGGVIGAVDFGMVGVLDEETRTNLLLMLLAIVDQDIVRLMDCMYRLGILTGVRDRAAARRDLERLMETYYDISLKDFDVSQFITEMMALIRRHHLILPTDLATLFKMLVMVEGLGRLLDPDFNILAVAQPYGQHAIARLTQPARVARQLRHTVFDVAMLAPDLVTRLDMLLRRLEDGTIRVETVDAPNAETRRLLQDVINRVVFSMLIAAFIVGLGLVILAIRPSGSDPWVRLLIVAGFVLTGALGMMFLWSLWRSGRS